MTERMRVLMTTDAVGGVWRYALDTARGLTGRGIEVALVGLGPAPDGVQREEARRNGIALDWLDVGLDWTANGPNEVQVSGRALNAWIAGRRAEILHINSPALIPFLDPGLPRLAATHSCLATWWATVKSEPLPEAWHWHRRLAWSGLAMAERAIAPSRAFAWLTQSVYGALPHLDCIPNACEPVAPKGKGEFVLSAGRWWDEGKNFAALDEAAASSDWPVLAAGPLEGPEGQVVRARNLRWLGLLPAAEMRAWMARAPIFTSLSVYEPFGLAVLEAASAGAALVLADIPTFRELWEGRAIFVDPHDPAAAARAFNRLSGDAGLRAHLGQAAAEHAGRYSLDAQARALASAYEGVLMHDREAV